VIEDALFFFYIVDVERGLHFGVFLSALNVEFEPETVKFVVFSLGFNVFEKARVHLDGDESNAVSEVLIGDDGGVLPHFDFINCDGRNLGDHDSAEGVGEGGLNSTQIEDNLFFV
jgi:hypothetical protein